MQNRNIPYGRQHITQADIDAVIETLQHPYLTQGPKIDEFEAAFADYVGAKYAVAVANGTAALHLCTLALGVNEMSNIITTPITFAASANCVRYCGGKVSFADIDPKTATIDIESVRQLLENAPKGTYQGIIPVDFAGYAVDLEALKALAIEHNLWIIEDACHAPGGFFTDSQGKKQFCGNGVYADLAIFSFHPVKHIACGEGGMITTNDKALYEKLLMLRTHGITKNPDVLEENHGGWYYEMQMLGFNYRIPDVLCALGLSQLQRAETGLARRRQIAKRYDEAFEGAVKHLEHPVDGGHAYHLYIVLVKDRKELYDRLRAVGIYAQIHYIPVHTLPYYKNRNETKWNLPAAEAYYEQCISLPMYPTLTDEEQDFVIAQVLNH
ncbi:UDP-4-amino-4,6-dideoxy-N-acetyl-beta-L-altrosamine transaminase [Aureispira anguillae]|uniref:UDP-4-amino-4, 6-dideoxy-N-acetyl-beta-L-altrosamine transaminase n=1 Tax=Aureispira anguillae TaxID=2864201 RepID=A0A915YJX4_9BACT|nr:UDP-4-amino-4,6-dideoxy-N-acetyl-beta-L-altrosamine transaminase [Aureispira anguillae]BDS14374.1 UDP-4-amino-4, 6-dideoxy-N-acetyl-beta-L-altrosamine transaminase [Aureispira anguillae]